MKEMSNKIKKETVKNVAKRPRLTKEEREARKLKIQEERAAKKAARLAKREAKKQKEAEKKAAAKAKREERKAKKAARLLAEKERKAAMKLKKQERAEAKKAREAARAEKKAERLAKKNDEKNAARDKNKTDNVKKVSIEDKIEYERNEWKALSAIRRYVKDEAKALGTLDGVKLERRLKKLEKMGYDVKLENGVPLMIGYSFSTEVKVSKVAGPKTEKTEKAQKPQKIKEETKEVKVQQPQDSVEPQIPTDDAEEEKLLTDEEILAAAAEDKETRSVEVLAGDTFKDETEIANDDSLGNFDDDDDDKDEDEDEDDDDTDDDDDDIFGTGGNVSREQEDYRREAFRDMEANGAWD